MGYPHATDEEKVNNQYQKLLRDYVKSSAETNYPVKELRKGFDGYTGKGTDPMHTNLMTWTKMLESMDMIIESINENENNLMNDELGNPDSELPVTTSEENPEPTGGTDELLSQLDKLFTPVLVMQGFENDASDKIQEAMSVAAEYTEKSIIKFDDETRMSQLIAVCAKLIARQKNTEEYQMYAKAHKIREQMALEIQKKEYDAAKDLAQKYLVKVSTTNNSSVARDAAMNLLPTTQH